jgi:hypothetical protein
MLIVLGLFASTIGLKLQAHRFTTDSVSNYVNKHSKYHLRNIANTGANFALNSITLNIEENEGVTNVPLFNGTYSYKLERQQQDPSLGITDVRVICHANYNNMTDTVIVLLTRPSFSRYAYFTNHEGNIWFATGDTIFGPCHTNTYFQMTGEPVFWGKVTSSKVYNANNPYRKSYWESTNPHFFGGTEWKVPELPMPTEIPQDLIDAAQNGGIYINKKHVWIEYQADGTVKIAAKNSSSNPPQSAYTTYNLSSMNGVIYVHYNSTRPTVRVEGTVNGKSTVGTRGNIRITSDIFYADNPLTNPNSDDMLGLVAAKDIIVYNSQHDQDRTIHATIMTMNQAIASNKNFWVHRYKNDRYGDLHLLGGLIQNSRGAVGLFGNQWSRKGYLKDYRWDPRLQGMSPPNFPMLFVLRKLAWWD